MKILFLTIGAVYNFDNSGAYTDLLKRFQKEGHDVYVVGAIEKRAGKETQLTTEHGIHVLRVRIGNITKTNLIEKGISTLTIGMYYRKAIEKYWGNESFNLILYTTPPITIARLVSELKKKYGAYTYLLLKDIFPQNAVDIGILSKIGLKGLIFRYFKIIEKCLYTVSDRIGCMSQANVDYLKKYNKDLSTEIIEICPNTIDVIPDGSYGRVECVLRKYNIPTDKYLLLYGGNFGKPQNVDYIIQAINKSSDIKKIHFVLCGSGTDFYKIEDYITNHKAEHITVINHLPYDEYVQLVASCDVGLLFLDYRFLIPNFPSRLLDYMNYGLPVIAATDVHTDVGQTILDGEFGWWVESKDSDDFYTLIKGIFEDENVACVLNEKSRNSRRFLKQNFETSRAYQCIIEAYTKDNKTQNKNILI